MMTTTELREILSAVSAPMIIGPLATKVPKIDYDFVVFVDGGTRLRTKDHTPCISIGDADSHDTAEDLDIVISREKNFSDLAFLLNHFPETVRKATFFGFIGGRLDHQLAVFGDLYNFLLNVEANHLVLENEDYIFLDTGSHEVSTEGTFSLIAFEEQKVKVTGAAKYKIDPAATLQPMSSFGLSNVGSGLVSIENEKPLLLIKGDGTLD